MTVPWHPRAKRLWAVAIAATTLAVSVVATTASASVDFPGAYPPGWTLLTIGYYTKSYVTYGGGGNFLICAHATNTATNSQHEACGHAGDPVPEARLLHCGGNQAQWYALNGDNSTHNMVDRLYENPC